MTKPELKFSGDELEIILEALACFLNEGGGTSEVADFENRAVALARKIEEHAND